MAEVLEPIGQDPLVVHTVPVMEMDDAQFFQFYQYRPKSSRAAPISWEGETPVEP